MDHYGLNKFGCRWNEVYKRVSGELLGIIGPVISQRQRLMYSVPIKSVGSYVERASLSKEIDDKLQQSDSNRPRPYAAAICGPGGTGKTQLALNFIKYHKDKFDPILWIDAENQDTARLSFERCAEALQIPVNPDLGAGVASETFDHRTSCVSVASTPQGVG